MINELKESLYNNKGMLLIILVIVIVILALGLGLGLGLPKTNAPVSYNTKLSSEAYKLGSVSLDNTIYNEYIANTNICFDVGNIQPDSLIVFEDDVSKYISDYFKISDICIYESNSASTECSGETLYKLHIFNTDKFDGFFIHTKQDMINNKTFLDIGSYIYNYYNNPNYATIFGYLLSDTDNEIYVIYVYTIDITKIIPSSVKVINTISANIIINSTEKNLNIINNMCTE